MDGLQEIKGLFEHRKEERLVWDGFLPNGKKRQVWENHDIDWDKHFAGTLKQGGRLSDEDGFSKCLVIDIDRGKDDPLIPAAKICEDAFKLDHTLICFKSPSENFHIYKFFKEPIATEVAAAEAMKLGREFKNLGYKVDFGKTLPKENGSKIGINFPFHTHQQSYDVRGVIMTTKQFLHSHKFQNYPLIKAATNLKEGEGGRPNTLLKIAALLEQENKMECLDEVINNFGDKFDDEKYIKRIKKDGIHKKYDIGDRGLSTAITEIVGFDYKMPDTDDFNIKDLNNEKAIREYEESRGFESKVNQPTTVEPEPFKVHWLGEGESILKPREWLMKGYLKAGNVTLLQAPPGSMKTTVGMQMVYCGVSGKPFMGHEVIEPGNGLCICPEEDINELGLKLKATEQTYGPITNGNRIAIRGIEDFTNLVKFDRGLLVKGKDYDSICKFIKDNKIKYILLDPLVSFQTGDFDENSNPQMDNYIKGVLIPLARINNGCLILVHHSRKPQFQNKTASRTINPWESMNEARGASSLPAAARIVMSLMPMTEGLWNTLYKNLIPENEIFRHIALIDAKNNYAGTNQHPLWCKKEIQEVRVEGGLIIDMPVLQESSLTQLQNAKSEMHEEHVRKKCSEYIVIIERHYKDKHIPIQCVSLHSIAKEIVATKTDISITKSGAIKKVVDELKKGFKRVHEVNGIEYVYYYDRWDGKAYHKMQRTDNSKVSLDL